MKRAALHLSPELEIRSAHVPPGGAFSQLREQMESSIMVRLTLDGRAGTAAGRRGLAYSPDPAVRKAAYVAELAAIPRRRSPWRPV